MIKNICIALGFLMVSVTPEIDTNNRIATLIRKEIKHVFGVEDYLQIGIQLPEEVNSTLKRPLTNANFFELKKNEESIGYYYIGRAFGKAAYFDFLILTDQNLTIAKIKILVYREDHGGEIGSKRWLKQFIGKTMDQSVVYQKDVAAISGATISAKAMTSEVNEFLISLRAFNKIKLHNEN